MVSGYLSVTLVGPFGAVHHYLTAPVYAWEEAEVERWPILASARRTVRSQLPRLCRPPRAASARKPAERQEADPDEIPF
jgi:hypothetical protein